MQGKNGGTEALISQEAQVGLPEMRPRQDAGAARKTLN